MDTLGTEAVLVVIVIPHLGDLYVDAFHLLLECVCHDKAVSCVSGHLYHVSRYRFIFRTPVNIGISIISSTVWCCSIIRSGSTVGCCSVIRSGSAIGFCSVIRFVSVVSCSVSGRIFAVFHTFLFDGIDNLLTVLVHRYIAEHYCPGSKTIRSEIFFRDFSADYFVTLDQQENHMIGTCSFFVVIVDPHLPCNNIPCFRNVGVLHCKALRNAARYGGAVSFYHIFCNAVLDGFTVLVSRKVCESKAKRIIRII